MAALRLNDMDHILSQRVKETPGQFSGKRLPIARFFKFIQGRRSALRNSLIRVALKSSALKLFLDATRFLTRSILGPRPEDRSGKALFWLIGPPERVPLPDNIPLLKGISPLSIRLPPLIPRSLSPTTA